MSYLVSLNDCPALPDAIRMQAEIRFARTLESHLGGPEGVESTYRTWIAANECAPADVSRDERMLAVKWPRAADAANQAGFERLGDLGEAHFDVRVEA